MIASTKHAFELVEDTAIRLGYRRLKMRVYKSDRSTAAVDHFLYFRSSIKNKGYPYVAGSMAFRNLEADLFGLQCLERYYEGYRGPGFPGYKKKTSASGSIEFGFLRDEFDRIYVKEHTEESFCGYFENTIENYVFPLVSKLQSKGDLLVYLIQNEEPFPWFRSNPIYRAAAIIYLGVEIGMKHSELLEIINRHKLCFEGPGYVSEAEEFALNALNDCLKLIEEKTGSV